MSGADNIYKYITTEGKVFGEQAKKFTMLEYLQKSTGVFNSSGMLSKEEVKEMKARVQSGEKNIWHGFISFDEQHSEFIDHPEKCIALVKQMFGEFFKDIGLDKDNIDLMCALHALQYIKSKFVRALLGIKKVTQHNPKDTWDFVPMQDFTEHSDIDWSVSVAEIDKQLYAKYKLSPDEISFIETMIKPME